MNNTLQLNIELLINQYNNYVFKIVHEIVGNSLTYQDIEEIVSDTFYLLWKNQNNINKDLKSYLSVIAKNCAYQKIRSNKNIIDYDDNLLVNYQELNDLIIIKDLINKLDKEEYEIFLLYYVDGYKIKEITKMKHKSISAIKMQLLRLRKKLKETYNNE